MKSDEKRIAERIREFYSIISGAKNVERNWNGLRALFRNDARLYINRPNKGIMDCSSYTVDEYIGRLKEFIQREDFYEFSTENDTKIIMNMCNIINEYEAYKDAEKKKPIKRGTNIINMIKEEGGWRIVSMVWEDEN